MTISITVKNVPAICDGEGPLFFAVFPYFPLLLLPPPGPSRAMYSYHFTKLSLPFDPKDGVSRFFQNVKLHTSTSHNHCCESLKSVVHCCV